MFGLKLLVFICAFVHKVVAYNYVFDAESCASGLSGVGIEDFIPKAMEDAAAFAADGFANFPALPASRADPVALKNIQPLIPDLFGSISEAEWNLVKLIFEKAAEAAAADPTSGKKGFVLRCPSSGAKQCTGNTGLMETFLNEGGDAATHLILICDDFWNSVKSSSNPMFRHFRGEHPSGINVCLMKPIDLGATFAGRLLYHETIHLFARQGIFAGQKFKDKAYLVDQNDIQKTKLPLVTMIQHTFYSKQNPDTYSFYALLTWRQKTCKWKAVFDQTRLQPLVAIEHDSDGDKGLYGPAQPCPGFHPDGPATRATIDVTHNGVTFQDFLWCKLADQSASCMDGWTNVKVMTLQTGSENPEPLLGCKMPKASFQFDGAYNVTGYPGIVEQT